MKLYFPLLGMAFAMNMIPAISVAAEGGWKTLNTQCIACHAVKKPATQDLDHIWKRKGPDLYYAGDKFRHDWLVKWLQKPTMIRPGGVFYRHVVMSGPKGDVIDTSKLTKHPRLTAIEAEAVAKVLMSLHGASGHILKGSAPTTAKGGRIGQMFFVKLRGCASCHQGSHGKGGESAPELYDAGVRLQPDYIYSYTKDPQSFDPHVWMPHLELSKRDLARLTGYLMSLDGKEE